MARALLCDEGDFNVSTGECAAPYFGEVPSSMPSLSISDAQAIGLAIALLWAVAFGIRMLKRALMQD